MQHNPLLQPGPEGKHVPEDSRHVVVHARRLQKSETTLKMSSALNLEIIRC